MSDIRVPDLGESIVEASILQWLKQAGDAVVAGDALAELETDKVNVEVIAEESGTLGSILKQAGESVQVGETIGVISAAGTAGATSATAPAAAAPSAQPQQAAAVATATPSQVEAQGGSGVPFAGQAAAPNGFIQAPPSVRRMAREHGIDLSQAAGGLGRVTGVDVKAMAAQGTNAIGQTGSSQASAASPVGVASGSASKPSAGTDRPDEERQRMTRRRLTIAKRLVEAQHTAAMLTTFNEIDMTNVMELRKRRKDKFQEQHGISLGFMSFFTKATVGALKAFPLLNAEIQGDDILVKHHYDIGIAVAAEGGLVVPVVRDSDRLSFAQIEREIARLAKKARDNALEIADLTGGTFTITNGGVFGSLFSTPILNAPQVGILGMHTISRRPVAVGDNIEIRPMMYVALSYDHRIVDGSEAVRFLATIKRLVEDPESLLLEG